MHMLSCSSRFPSDQSPAACDQTVGGSDTQPVNMDLGEEDDLFTYRGRNNGPPAVRQTAHVAPVAAGRRPDDQLAYAGDQKPGRFNPGRGGHFQPGPPRRPPPSSHRFAADDYYTNSSRYDRDFSRDDSSNSPGGGLLADLMPSLTDDHPFQPNPAAVKSEPVDIFKSRAVARNPSPDRNPAAGPPPHSYRNFDTRPRYDNFTPPHHSAADHYNAGPEPQQQRDDRPAGEMRVRREDPRTGPRNTYDRSAYPAKGTTRAEDTRSLPAVYELPKIQKRTKAEDELNEQPEEKIVRLRVEHAKLEMRIQMLGQVVESANAREMEIRRSAGSSLADNKKFSDTMKLLNDAKRQLEAARQEYSFKDDVIKKLLQKPTEKNGASDKPKEQIQVLATHFLNEKREEREEDTDNSSKLEFFDGADHWCQQCNFFAATVQEHLSHLHCADHWAKNKPNATALWPLIKRASNFDQDRSLAAIKGTQFMVPCHAFYCAVCKVFQGDAEAAEEHLFSITHNKMVQRFFMSKPEYEHLYNKDRMSAKSKAEADARMQKREAEARRIREEEARKKAQEEDNRKRENEIRERLVEENKHIKRMRELEDQKEKAKLRKDRDRVKEKERERERKRKTRIQLLSSDEEIVSSDDESTKSAHDPKLKTPCYVSISCEEMEKALSCFQSNNRTIQSGKVAYTASSTAADAQWTSVSTRVIKTESQNNPVSAVKTVTIDFNDDSDEEFSLSTVSSMTAEKVQAVTALPSSSGVRKEDDSAKKLQPAEPAGKPESSQRVPDRVAEPVPKQDSPMEELILNALTDCLTPPVIAEEEVEPAKKNKKSRIEVITGDDAHDDAGDMDTAPAASDFDDGAQFPSLSLDDLVTKSP